jgi:hypothetical protein
MNKIALWRGQFELNTLEIKKEKDKWAVIAEGSLSLVGFTFDVKWRNTYPSLEKAKEAAKRIIQEFVFSNPSIAGE